MYNKGLPISLLEHTVWAKEKFFQKINEPPAEEVTIKRKSLMSADQGIPVWEWMLRMNGEV